MQSNSSLFVLDSGQKKPNRVRTICKLSEYICSQLNNIGLLQLEYSFGDRKQKLSTCLINLVHKLASIESNDVSQSIYVRCAIDITNRHNLKSFTTMILKGVFILLSTDLHQLSYSSSSTTTNDSKRWILCDAITI